MGKQQNNSILSLLTKAARPVTFLISQPPSPVKAASGKGFAGPIISLVPKEARRHARNGSFHAREPTSPKVSCIGHIKNKKKNRKAVTKPRETIPGSSYPKLILKNLTVTQKQKGKSDAPDPDEKLPSTVVKVPSLGHMKKFPSARKAPETV